jgi:hypothetical protein
MATTLTKEHLLVEKIKHFYCAESGGKEKGPSKHPRTCTINSMTVKAYLNHSRMIANVVSRPWSPILHCPSFLRNLLGFSNQGIDSDLEFLILSLEK